MLYLGIAIFLSQAPHLPVLTLAQALEQADRQNQDLEAARARLQQADELSAQAWAGYLPRLTADGRYTYNTVEASIRLPTSYWIRDVGVLQGPAFDPSRPASLDNPPGQQTSLVQVPAEFQEAVIQPQHSLNANFVLSQALVAPQLWANISNAYKAERAATLNTENIRREILFATAQLYYAAEGYREAIAVQERLLEVTQAREKDAELQLRVGTSTKVALLRAQIERARAEQDLLRTRNAYRAAKVALATVLARDPDFDVTRPQAPPPPPSLQVLLDSAQERPDVAAAKANLELAQGQRTSVVLSYFPSLSAFGQYSVANAQGFTGQYDVFAAGLQLTWTLWDGGLRESQLREASGRILENQHVLRGLELRAREDVMRALLDLESARANVVKASEQVVLARESAALVNSSFQAGAATYLEVVDANAALHQAELNAISEELNEQLAVIRVAYAAGGLDSALQGHPERRSVDHERVPNHESSAN